MDSAKKELRSKIIEKYFFEISSWERSLIFLSEEIRFLNRLLSIKIYQPSIPDLKVRLQGFSRKLQDLENEEKIFEIEISKHKTDFLNGLEDNDELKNYVSKNRHIQLRKNINSLLRKNSLFKLEVFSFAGNLLKKSI